MSARYGVVIANTGTPDAPTPEAVRSYLAEFLSDPRICPVNPLVWNVVLHAFILPRRCVASARKYSAVWTEQGSPLMVAMGSLASRLEASLRAEGLDCAVRPAMSYGSPSMGDALPALAEQGCEDAVVIPLYPQAAFSTTKVCADKLQSAARSRRHPASLRLVEGYDQHPLYLRAIADSVAQAGFDAAAGDRLLFAFHSVPMADVRTGDRYGERAHATAEAVAALLGLVPAQWAIGFQSRFDRGRVWLTPTVPEAMEGLGEVPGTLFVVAPNFAVDCLETLYDIDQVLRKAYCGQAPEGAQGAGASQPTAPEGRSLRYVRCLNDSDAQVALLSALVRESLAPEAAPEAP